MKSNKYAFSFTEDEYTGEYDTPEEAAQEAFETDDDALRVFVGECVKPKLEDYLDAEGMLERITENNEEQYSGEWCQPWLESLFSNKAAIGDLDSQLIALVRAWVEKHGLQPTFFNVENVREFKRSEIMGAETEAK